jgi:hypothetical protein
MATTQLTTAPDLTGKTKAEALDILTQGGLAVGAVTEAASDTVPVGQVISSSPLAGVSVSPAARVDIVVSRGRAGAAQVKIPDVTGLTRFAADGTLRSAGLALGAVSTARNSAIPAGGVVEQSLAPGTLVPAGSKVDVQVSSGAAKGPGDWVRGGVFSLLAIILFGGVIWFISQTQGNFLDALAEEKKARGLITFLIAITTVGIAVMLALSTVLLEDSTENDKRFDRGKQVLTILIGVLGTIVGFYFGSVSSGQTAQASANAPAALTITTQALPPGTVKQPYSVTLAATGGTPPLTWSVTGLPAGLTFEPKNNSLTGMPSASGNAQVTVTVNDSSTPPRKAEKSLPLEVK